MKRALSLLVLLSLSGLVPSWKKRTNTSHVSGIFPCRSDDIAINNNETKLAGPFIMNTEYKPLVRENGTFAELVIFFVSLLLNRK